MSENYAMSESQSPSGDKSVMSVGSWMITILIMMVPCINIIMLFVWGFGNGNENRKNYSRAALIFTAIIVVLYGIIGIMFGAAIMNGISNLS